MCLFMAVFYTSPDHADGCMDKQWRRRRFDLLLSTRIPSIDQYRTYRRARPERTQNPLSFVRLSDVSSVLHHNRAFFFANIDPEADSAQSIFFTNLNRNLNDPILSPVLIAASGCTVKAIQSIKLEDLKNHPEEILNSIALTV